MRWFEDIVVGERAAFGRREVDRDEVIAFATRFDPQPFHLNEAAAAETHFGRLAASGWHTCSLMMAMYVDHLRDHPQAAVGGTGVDTLRWVKPVYPGDTLRCESEVVETSRNPERPFGKARVQITVLNQHDEVVLSLIAIGLVRCRD